MTGREFSIDEIKVEPLGPSVPTRILALSGGGYRGLFSVGVLAEIEGHAKCDSSRTFDLIAGTSIGGIVACALAVGISGKEIRAVMELDGGSIFGSGSWLARTGRGALGVVAPKFGKEQLRNVIQKTLGPHSSRKLSEVDAPLLLPAVSYTSGRAVMLCSRGLVGRDAPDITLLDAALATSAAPTYFPAHAIGNEVLVDGGLVANAPDAVALAYAVRHLGASTDHMVMLSIGTAGAQIAQPSGPEFKSGKVGWLLRRKLVNLTLTAQERLAVDVVESLLGKQFFRVDAHPSPAQQKVLGLDRADVVARRTLNQLADQSTDRLFQQRSRDMWQFFQGDATWVSAWETRLGLEKQAAEAAAAAANLSPDQEVPNPALPYTPQ